MRTSRSHSIGWFVFAAILFLVFPFFLAAQSGGGQSLITRPVDESHLIVLEGNTYPLALPRYDHGPAPASLPMDRMLLVLKRGSAQQAALDALLQSQQVKSSSDYHRWLTPAQFGSRFGPSDQDVQTIVAWLQSHGFRIDGVASGRGVIEFSGDAGQVQQVFHTAIHKYVTDGKSHWANAADPQIPSALIPAVAGIVSLNDFRRMPAHRLAGIFRKSKNSSAAIPVQPAFDVSCGSFTCYALGPYDFATIYNVLPLWNAGVDGSGQTIAIVARSDINLQDINDFRSGFGLPPANVQVIHNGPDPGIQNEFSDETESDLDVEWSGAVAKGAKIDFVVSESTETTDGVDLSAEYIVDNDLAPVMSESYGECELGLGAAGNQFYSQLWQQAAAEGITVAVSTGDGGSALCDVGQKGATHGFAVNGLASTPYNVAIGGTDFDDAFNPSTYWNSTNDPTTQVSAKGYILERTWNDSCTNQELSRIPGGSSNPQANCNNSSLLSQFPFLSYVVGGSGGASNCIKSDGQTISSCSGGNPKPAWQSGAGVPSDSVRDLPDVSLFASDGFNGSFYILCEADLLSGAQCNLASGEFLGVGGTSASSPAFAGIMAMIDQKTQSRQGNANYVLYPLAAQSGATCPSAGVVGSSCIFYDTGVGTIAMPCVSGSPDCTATTGSVGVLNGYSTAANYDLATGLGSVNAANLAAAWSSISFQPSTTTLQLNGGSAVNIVHGAPVSYSVAVTPNSPLPTGSVSLIATPNSSHVSVGAFPLSKGAASGTITNLPGGTSYNVVAHYPGDGAYGASDSAPVAVSVGPEPSVSFANLIALDSTGKITSFNSSGGVYGNGIFLLRLDVGDSAATYSSASGISSTCSSRQASCPTGVVSVTANGSPLDGGSFPLNTRGYAEDQFLTAGDYAVTASYPGDASYGPSSASASFSIAKAQTSTSATFPAAVQYGAYVQILAGVTTSSDAAAPTGTISLSDNGAPLTTASLSYKGSPYNPNASPPYASYTASGTAYFTTTGTHTLQAQYTGDANYLPSASSSVSLAVTQAQPYFSSVTASPQSPNQNQQATLSATLLGSFAGAPPTGSMAFYVDNTALTGTVSYTSVPASGPNAASLQGSISYVPPTAGSHSITVEYSGDTNYLTATSPGTSFTVLGPGFQFAENPNPPTITISSPGASGSSVVTVNSTDGYTGTVDFSAACPAAPAEMTCTISPASAMLSSSATSASATLTVATTAPSLIAPDSQPPRFLGPARLDTLVLLSMFCLYFLLLWRAKPRLRWSTAVGLLLLASVVTWSGCGGGGSSPSSPSNPGTPPGPYTVVVTGTSGNITHTINVPVTVQ